MRMDAPMFPPSPRFPAMLKPTSDFQSVRDGRSTGPLYIDIPLDTARSVAAGTALELLIAGNVMYFDQRPNSGVATLYIESDDRGFTPLTVFAGWKAKVPFTRIYVENIAQTGCTLRLVYGVDIDLDPGTGAGVSVLNPVQVEDSLGTNPQHSYVTTTVPVGNNAIQIIDGISAPRGIRIRNIYLAGAAGAGGTITLAVMVADSFWSASFATTQRAIALACLSNWTTGVQQLNVPMRMRVPFTLGQPTGIFNRLFVFYSATTAVGSCEAAVDYEVL